MRTLSRICILIFAVLVLQASTGNLYVSKGNIFNRVFTDTFETIIFIMRNGDSYSFTMQEEDEVCCLSLWLDVLKEDGYTAKDITIIMHNHFAKPFFSTSDKRAYVVLKMNGFTGSFGIYVTATDKVYLIKKMK